MLVLAEAIADRDLVSQARTPMAAAPDAVRESLVVFGIRLIADLLLDVTLIQAMVGDPQAAAHSRCSFSG